MNRLKFDFAVIISKRIKDMEVDLIGEDTVLDNMLVNRLKPWVQTGQIAYALLHTSDLQEAHIADEIFRGKL